MTHLNVSQVWVTCIHHIILIDNDHALHSLSFSKATKIYLSNICVQKLAVLLSALSAAALADTQFTAFTHHGHHAQHAAPAPAASYPAPAPAPKCQTVEEDR